MKKLIITLICVTLIFQVGCTDLSAIAKDTPKSYPVHAKSEDGNFQFTLTDGWKYTNVGELNSNADLEVKNEDGTLCVIAIMQPKSSNYFTDLEDFRDQAILSNSKNYNTSLGEPINTKLGIYTSYLNEFSSTIDNDNFHLWMYSIETSKYYGQVIICACQEIAKEHEEELLKIANSFRVTNVKRL